MYSRKLETGVKGTKIDNKFDDELKKNNLFIQKKFQALNVK